MKHRLFDEIAKFIDWANSNYNLPHDEIGGEWEFDYPQWESIYNSFLQFIKEVQVPNWSNEEQDKLLYIIARDNESEFIANNLSEEGIIRLTEKAIKQDIPNAKWQLVIQLHRLMNKELAFEFLEKLVNDTNEYVARRSLMEMAKVKHPKTEECCEMLWNKNTFGDAEEYQRMAILFSLNEIKSDKLLYYIEQAKKDGRKYLVDYALRVEMEVQSNH